MSAKLVTDIIDKCGVNFDPTDCANNVDGSCILQITLNCFKQMITNATAESALAAAAQTGGGKGSRGSWGSKMNLISIIPYLQAHRIQRVDDGTLLPAGILSTVLGRAEGGLNSPEYWKLVPAGTVLNRSNINEINREIN